MEFKKQQAIGSAMSGLGIAGIYVLPKTSFSDGAKNILFAILASTAVYGLAVALSDDKK